MVCRNVSLVFLYLSFVYFFQNCLASEIFEYVDPNSCDDQEYFSITQLQCIQCDPEGFLQPNDNRLSCGCEESSILISNVGEYPKCRPCPSKHRPSLDRKKCIPCVYNSSSEEICEYCAVNEIQVDRDSSGEWLKASKCVECSADTVPSSDRSTCVPCPFEVPLDGNDDNAFAVNCSCPSDTHELLQHGPSRLLCIPHKDLTEWPDETSSYTIKYESGGSVVSRYLQDNLRSTAYLCMVKSEEKACQELANMCALTGFHMTTNIVIDVRRRIFGSQRTPTAQNPCQPFQPTSASSDQLPWIFYGEGEASAALSKKKITAQYGMGSSAMNTWLNLTAVRYAPDGTFLGMNAMALSKLSLCPEAAIVNDEDFFRFGAPNKISCKLPLRAVLNHSTEFMDLFLSYHDGTEGSSTTLYALPILSFDVQLDGNPINKGNEESQWQLVRRLFVFDGISGINVGSEIPSFIRYLKSCHIRVRLRGREEEGLIYPPLIKVQYGEINLEDESTDPIITTTISVDYEQPDGFLMKPVEVWSGILGAVAVLIAFLQAWSSIRRDSITLPSSAAAPVWFVRCLCLHAAGRLADAALIIAGAASVRTLVLYKGQSVPHITLPVVPSDSVLTGEGIPEEDALIQTYIIVAFSLKCIEILHILVSQSSVDIFFLDWERPRPLGTSYYSGSDSSSKRSLGGSGDMSPTPHPVSAWRMCFVANEWNELQAIRRTSTLFQIIGALFFLKVLGFENWAVPHPDLNLQPPELLKDAPPSMICHVAVGIIVYTATYLCQIIFVVVYEHYGKNSIQEFVDLCSMANISVMIFPWLYFGFYVHGRSAHGFADTDLSTLKECLRREADDACGTRGLVPDGMERQTFRIAVPPAFRTCYDRLLSLTLSSAANISTMTTGMYPSARRASPTGIWGGRIGGNGMATPGPSSGFIDGNDQAYQGMNKFLSAFLEHALKEIDYEVRDKLFMEALLDMELTEPLEYGIFYNDNGHSFDQVLLYGNELTLAAFNLLTFMFVDAIFLDYVLAAIVTVFLDKVIIWVRRVSGKRNIARKALIDERFLI